MRSVVIIAFAVVLTSAMPVHAGQRTYVGGQGGNGYGQGGDATSDSSSQAPSNASVDNTIVFEQPPPPPVPVQPFGELREFPSIGSNQAFVCDVFVGLVGCLILSWGFSVFFDGASVTGVCLLVAGFLILASGGLATLGEGPLQWITEK